MRKQMGVREGAAAQGRFLAALCDIFPPPGVHIQPATAAAVLLYTSDNTCIAADGYSVLPATCSAAIASCKLHASDHCAQVFACPLGKSSFVTNNVRQLLSKLG